jgi:hypothetical protein
MITRIQLLICGTLVIACQGAADAAPPGGFIELAKYGPAPTAEEIDANRADMFRNFGEDSWR